MQEVRSIAQRLQWCHAILEGSMDSGSPVANTFSILSGTSICREDILSIDSLFVDHVHLACRYLHLTFVIHQHVATTVVSHVIGSFSRPKCSQCSTTTVVIQECTATSRPLRCYILSIFAKTVVTTANRGLILL